MQRKIVAGDTVRKLVIFPVLCYFHSLGNICEQETLWGSNITWRTQHSKILIQLSYLNKHEAEMQSGIGDDVKMSKQYLILKLQYNPSPDQLLQCGV